MNYKVPEGYVIATEHANDLAIRHQLNDYQKNILYRYLLDKAKEGNRKYNDNPNSRIWLLDITSYDEDKLIKSVKNDNSQRSFFDKDYKNISNPIDNISQDTTTVSKSINLDVINLIEKVNNSNLDNNTKLKLIKIICSNETSL